MTLVEEDTSPVDCYCHMLVLVCVDSDDHLSYEMILVSCDSHHLCLLGQWRISRVSGHNCEETQGHAPMKSLLASAISYLWPSRERVDRSF